jgi:hypothetical protein
MKFETTLPTENVVGVASHALFGRESRALAVFRENSAGTAAQERQMK